MLNQLNQEVFRQKIAALDKDEVEIACDILVAMHPAAYFNALSHSFKNLLQVNEEVGAIYKERYHEYQRLIGNESMLVTIPRPLVNPIRPVEIPDTMVMEDNNINEISTEDIKVPNFLPNKKEKANVY